MAKELQLRLQHSFFLVAFPSLDVLRLRKLNVSEIIINNDIGIPILNPRVREEGLEHTEQPDDVHKDNRALLNYRAIKLPETADIYRWELKR